MCVKLGECITGRFITWSLSVYHLHACGFMPSVSPCAVELSSLRPLLNIYRGSSGEAGKSNIHFHSAKFTHRAPLICLFLDFYLWHESEYCYGYVSELSRDCLRLYLKLCICTFFFFYEYKFFYHTADSWWTGPEWNEVVFWSTICAKDNWYRIL